MFSSLPRKLYTNFPAHIFPDLMMPESCIMLLTLSTDAVTKFLVAKIASKWGKCGLENGVLLLGIDEKT